ncbi:hypothetical protein Trydic_g1494 [Trypoxylus dichotomus]
MLFVQKKFSASKWINQLSTSLMRFDTPRHLFVALCKMLVGLRKPARLHDLQINIERVIADIRLNLCDQAMEKCVQWIPVNASLEDS